MTTPPSPLTPPLRLYLLLNALAAVWLAFSGIHQSHNADSIMFTLISIYKLSPFYWQQDRIGMLVPGIASICPDPIFNLVLQTGLMTFAGLCLPLLLAELIYPHPASRAAATFANAAMFLLAPNRIIENLLYECCYPLAMTLGCAGALVLGRGPGWPRWWRIVIATAFLLLACWVYVGVPLWLGPLMLIRGWTQPGEHWPAEGWRALLRPALHPRTMLGCCLLVIAFGAGLEWMRMARLADPEMISKTPRDALPTTEWAASWKTYALHLEELPGMTEWALGLLGAAGLGVVATLIAFRRPDYPILAAAAVLLIPAAIEFLFIGTREWTAKNGHHPRYLLGAIESVQTFLALMAMTPLANLAAGRGRWAIGFLAAATLFAAATVRYGFPSPDRPRRDLNALTGRWTADLFAANVDAVGGDYWIVWPIVYHANMVRQQNGDDRFVYAVTLRSKVLLREWKQTHCGELRVAVPKDGNDLYMFFYAAAQSGLLPPRKIGEQGPFDIYVTRSSQAGP
jgi:hypothetical protein